MTLRIVSMIILSSLVAISLSQGVHKTRNEDLRLVEGDILMTEEQENNLLGKTGHGYAGYPTWIWPKVIPYKISDELKTNHPNVAADIRSAMDEYERNTCLRFIERTNQPGYMNFQKGLQCRAPYGYYPKPKDISLAPYCWKKGTIIHEMGHSLGVIHEHSRKDRDGFVILQPNNMVDGAAKNFKIKPNAKLLGLPYDYDSIMHYGGTFFSKRPGALTLRTIDPANQHRIGQRRGLSPLDIQKFNKLYNCNSVTDMSTPQPPQPPQPTTRTILPETVPQFISGPHSSVFCEGRNQLISCSRGNIVIGRVIFGYASDFSESRFWSVCNHNSIPRTYFNCKSSVAKQNLSVACNGRSSCGIQINKSVLGTPTSDRQNVNCNSVLPGVRSYFSLEYFCA